MSDMTEQQFVEMIVKAIVDNPDDVKTDKTVDDRGVLISLTLNPEDMGKIIGKGGRTVNSIRKLLHVFGAKTDERINLKIFEPDGGEVRMPEDDGGHDHAPKEDAKAETAKEEQKDETEELPAEVEEVPEVEEAPVAKSSKLDDVPTDVLV